MDRDERRRVWDERHRSGDFEGPPVNPAFMAAVTSLAPGRALELAAGSGAAAVWLATQGWQVTAVDWSLVGLARGRERAAEAGVEVEWREEDLLDWRPPADAFDLVALIYLQLSPEERRVVYGGAAAAVAPGGRLVIVGHDLSNLTEGEGGPRGPERLFTAESLAAELTAADPSLIVERAEVVRQVPPRGRGPIDALLVLRRPVPATG
jgi:SAM-dependent methyltransferase